MATISAFAADLLKSIGAPATAANVKSIEDWAAREGGGGANNPLNTTLVTSGSTGAINSVGVQNYANTGDGVTATAQTLGGYPAIVAALKSGKGIISGESSSVASELSKWSGGGYTSVSGASEPGSSAVSGGTAQLDSATGVPGWLGGAFDIAEGPIGILNAIGSELVGTVSGGVGTAQSFEGIWKSLDTFTKEIDALLTGVEWLFVPSHWVRIIAFTFGAGTAVPGLHYLARAGQGDMSLAVGILLTVLAGLLFFIAFHNLPDDITSLSDLLQWESDALRKNTPKPAAGETVTV